MPQYIPGGILFPTGEAPVDPGYGQGHPRPPHVGGGPIVVPPVPGWSPPGVPALPIEIPPEVALPPFPGPPIVIEPPPDKPNPIPPGSIWPDLPPELAGKLVMVIVLGEGIRKLHLYHVPPPSISGPPTAQPKR